MTKPHGRNYLDVNGNDMNNKIVDGKICGRNNSEYQKVTHFIILTNRRKMSRERMIRVPKDVKAMYGFDYGVQESDQMEEVVLTEKEFIELDSIGAFDLINEKCQVIIDDYEEEIIELEKIPVALEVIMELRNEFTSESLINLKKILEKALEYKTLVAFEF